jgi:hypothetical protein
MSDRLFSACCYGTDQQHPDWEPCPQFVCAGCSKGPEHAEAHAAAFVDMLDQLEWAAKLIRALVGNVAQVRSIDATIARAKAKVSP